MVDADQVRVDECGNELLWHMVKRTAAAFLLIAFLMWSSFQKMKN